MGRFAMFFCSI